MIGVLLKGSKKGHKVLVDVVNLQFGGVTCSGVEEIYFLTCFLHSLVFNDK